ncbi:hypothetical protein Sgleb_25490 [Streptomyces glebosus]|uniref:Uncharacterized protein n=1 Tax=Streptomyces glebosus TaxID=249580 RepID=A0A640SUF2_9ACTN|nr:hypothetical protein [Streptomyces glebosus]GFE14502.1 hypothetical protein Sgleb_25490 [Streptomyces glebosus]GHG55882.1 hypothetical protein GCM10010513_18320 [Streptomyces glebosus]
MISIIETNKMTDLSVVAPCTLGSSLPGTGLSGFGRLSGTEVARPESLTVLTRSERTARPTEAPAAAVVAASANAFAFAAANGAESRQQYQTKHEMWAYRGLEPWRDPA